MPINEIDDVPNYNSTYTSIWNNQYKSILNSDAQHYLAKSFPEAIPLLTTWVATLEYELNFFDIMFDNVEDYIDCDIPYARLSDIDFNNEDGFKYKVYFLYGLFVLGHEGQVPQEINRAQTAKVLNYNEGWNHGRNNAGADDFYRKVDYFDDDIEYLKSNPDIYISWLKDPAFVGEFANTIWEV